MARQVKDIIKELRRIREETREIQSTYKQKAEQRIEYQNKMAKINQMVQRRSRDDAMLVEDVIVITLQAETEAQERYSHVPFKPTPQELEAVQPGQRTKDPKEAIKVYQAQIDELQRQIDYYTAMAMAERDMDNMYRTAIDEILDLMDRYCHDETLRNDLATFAESGIAPCSPRKAPSSRQYLNWSKKATEHEDTLPPAVDLQGSPKIGTPPLVVDPEKDEEANKEELSDDEKDDDEEQEQVDTGDSNKEEEQNVEQAPQETTRAAQIDEGAAEEHDDPDDQEEPPLAEDEEHVAISEEERATEAQFGNTNDGSESQPDESKKKSSNGEEPMVPPETVLSGPPAVPTDDAKKAKKKKSKKVKPEESAVKNRELEEDLEEEPSIPVNDGDEPYNIEQETGGKTKKKKKRHSKKSIEPKTGATVGTSPEKAKSKQKKKPSATLAEHCDVLDRAKKSKEADENENTGEATEESASAKKKKKKKSKSTSDESEHLEEDPSASPSKKKKKKKPKVTSDESEELNEDVATEKKKRKKKKKDDTLS